MKQLVQQQQQKQTCVIVSSIYRMRQKEAMKIYVLLWYSLREKCLYRQFVLYEMIFFFFAFLYFIIFFITLSFFIITLQFHTLFFCYIVTCSYDYKIML